MNREDEFFDLVERGDVAGVRALVGEDGALARTFGVDGATALHHAAFHGHREIVDLLLKAGADINARDETHHATPMGWAIEHLRERGGLLAIEIDDLLFAIERCDVAWAERLIERHPALRKAVDLEGTPLWMYAARSSDPQIAQLFADP